MPIFVADKLNGSRQFESIFSFFLKFFFLSAADQIITCTVCAVRDANERRTDVNGPCSCQLELHVDRSL